MRRLVGFHINRKITHHEAENEDNVSDGGVHGGFSGKFSSILMGVSKVHRSKPDVR